MELIESIGFIAGTLVAISSLPQVIKSWNTKKTTDISMAWLVINSIGQILWLLYGFFKKSISLMVMSAITFLMVSSIIILKKRYR